MSLYHVSWRNGESSLSPLSEDALAARLGDEDCVSCEPTNLAFDVSEDGSVSNLRPIRITKAEHMKLKVQGEPMKATLEFNLDDPDDRKRHMRSITADDLYAAMADFAEALRKVRKYSEDPDATWAEKWEILFNETLAEHNIDRNLW